jgi:hypothetical protein
MRPSKDLTTCGRSVRGSSWVVVDKGGAVRVVLTRLGTVGAPGNGSRAPLVTRLERAGSQRAAQQRTLPPLSPAVHAGSPRATGDTPGGTPGMCGCRGNDATGEPVATAPRAGSVHGPPGRPCSPDGCRPAGTRSGAREQRRVAAPPGPADAGDLHLHRPRAGLRPLRGHLALRALRRVTRGARITSSGGRSRGRPAWCGPAPAGWCWCPPSAGGRCHAPAASGRRDVT